MRVSRRDALRSTACGFGLLALADLLDAADNSGGLTSPGSPLQPKKPHFPAKAKSVIWLSMNGGPSQVDTWDYRPELMKRDGQELKGFDHKTGFFVDQVGPLMKGPLTTPVSSLVFGTKETL